MAPTPSPIIPAGAQPVIAGLLERMRDDTCLIQRLGSSKDGAGAPTGAYSTAATVPCRVKGSQRQPVEGVAGARLGVIVDYEVRFAPGVDVQSEDRIIVNGRTLRVVADQDAASHGFELVVNARAVES
ncbi:MAG: head-tail adaptor protein [Thermomicrobiales bacterium]|nr:head-tail adaptor protein [Thermomicrobiales bacterium]